VISCAIKLDSKIACKLFRDPLQERPFSPPPGCRPVALPTACCGEPQRPDVSDGGHPDGGSQTDADLIAVLSNQGVLAPGRTLSRLDCQNQWMAVCSLRVACVASGGCLLRPVSATIFRAVPLHVRSPAPSPPHFRNPFRRPGAHQLASRMLDSALDNIAPTRERLFDVNLDLKQRAPTSWFSASDQAPGKPTSPPFRRFLIGSKASEGLREVHVGMQIRGKPSLGSLHISPGVKQSREGWRPVYPA